MFRKYSIISLLAITISMGACQKEKNSVSFYYDQTLCSDPWGSGQNTSDAEIESSVRDYLDEQNIKVFSVTVDRSNTFTNVCEACHCTNGVKIIVTVDERKQSKMEDIGFKKQ